MNLQRLQALGWEIEVSPLIVLVAHPPSYVEFVA